LTKFTPFGVRTTTRPIIVVIGVVFVVMWALVAFSVVTSRHAALDAGGLEGRNLMIAFREEIASVLRGVDGETLLLAERMRRDGDGFDLYAWGQEIALVAPAIARAVIVSPDGMLKSATAEAHPSSLDLSDREYFRVQLDRQFRGLYVGQPIIGRILGAPVLPISRRVEAADGTFLGVIVILISPSSLTSLHKLIDLGPHGAMTLAGIDNVIRARFSADSPDGTKGIGSSVAGGSRPGVIEVGGQGWYVRTSARDGISRLFTFGRVGSYPLVVRVGLDLDQVLAAWNLSVAMIIATALCATLLLVALADYLIRQIYRDVATIQGITHSAEHDLLTGLPNRTLLNARLSFAFDWARRHKSKVAVMFVNLDGLKRINDAFGRGTGDKLLQSAAKRLAACVRNSDTASRVGDDEFVVLLSEIRRPEDAAIIARKLLGSVAEPHSIDQHDIHVTISVGISVYPDDGLDADALIRNADIAMSEAKERGRDGARFYTRAMNDRAAERQFIEEGLRYALERHEFALHYQPKINLKTGAITGAEALLRWTHPTRGAIAPLHFIPVAEDCGLIVPIGAWVLREACAQAQAWIDAGLPAMTMAVNISAVEFRSHDFLSNLFAVLQETRLDPRLLEVELTESLLMTNAESATSILQALRASGIQVAIDDFGTGFSSLGYLRKFPLDALKIDQSFVGQITATEENTAIVTAIISMARSLKLRIIAEGVENVEHVAFLQAHQCDEAQGYYFSRPVPSDQFAKLLETGIPQPVSLDVITAAGSDPIGVRCAASEQGQLDLLRR
jgi:diguanylate cyclase (GGDEF)-like protein